VILFFSLGYISRQKKRAFFWGRVFFEKTPNSRKKDLISLFQKKKKIKQLFPINKKSNWDQTFLKTSILILFYHRID